MLKTQNLLRLKGFIINLEKFKVASSSGNVNVDGQFWELANEVLD